jgi:hypothetical protein
MEADCLNEKGRGGEREWGAVYQHSPKLGVNHPIVAMEDRDSPANFGAGSVAFRLQATSDLSYSAQL